MHSKPLLPPRVFPHSFLLLAALPLASFDFSPIDLGSINNANSKKSAQDVADEDQDQEKEEEDDEESAQEAQEKVHREHFPFWLIMLDYTQSPLLLLPLLEYRAQINLVFFHRLFYYLFIKTI